MKNLFVLASVAALMVASGCAGVRQSCWSAKHSRAGYCDTCNTCGVEDSTYYSPVDDGVWMDGDSTIESLPTPGPATTSN